MPRTSLPLPAPSLERLPEVRARVGLSRTEIYRRVANKTFPSPVRLGPRATAWLSSEIDDWIATQAAARDARGSR